MGTKPLLIGCLLLVITLHSTSAADESSIVQLPDTPSLPLISIEDRFKIPEVTRDVRFDEYISGWVADSVMRFAHDLGVALDQDEYPNTQIFSPLSVMSALSILHMGSNTNSYNQLSTLFPMLGRDSVQMSWKIHEEFGWMLEDLMTNKNNPKRPRNESAWRRTPANRNAFGKGGKDTPNEHIIRVANGLFVQEGFSLRPDFQNAAQSVYKSEVTSLDFRRKKEHAKQHINSWVNQNTLGKIPAIISDEVNSDTNMIIASALYFKGFWEQPFLGSGTSEANFFPDGPSNPSVRVQMMGTGGVYPYYDSPEYNCHIIGLPYKGNLTTMYIIQPHDSTRRNLYDLQNFLTGEKINELISKMERKTSVVAFPKFHVTNTLHLKTPLIRMGIQDIFKNGASDLSLIADAEQNIGQVASAFPLPQPVQRPIFNRQQHENLQLAPVFQPQQAASSNQRNPTLLELGISDRYNEDPLIFSRFSENTNVTGVPIRPAQGQQVVWNQQGDLMTGRVSRQQQRTKRTVTYKVESEFMRSNIPLRLKDLILNKRITKTNPGKKISRSRRQALPASAASLQNLDRMRSAGGLRKPQLYVDDILHKVDFEVNEQGTEAAAATLTYLRRSGTDVAFRCDSPFLLLIRHDPTKLPLFYGKVNIPL